MDVSFDPQVPSMKVTLELLPEHFNKEGNMTLHQFARLLEIAQSLTVYHFRAKNIFPSNQLDIKMTSVFVRYQGATFSKQFWETLHCAGNPNLCVTLTVSNIGKTSYMLKGEVAVPGSSSSLAQHYVQMVHVSTESRRPVSLPQWVFEKYSHLRESSHPENMQPLTAWPDRLHKYCVTVTQDDIDVNQHTNQATYVKYVEQAFMDGVRNGFYTILGETTDTFYENVGMLYRRETVLGDHLEVLSWEDAVQPGKVLFQILKSSTPVFDCFVWYSKGSSKERTHAKL